MATATTATRITQACKTANKSQRSLSHTTGIPQATLSRIFTGARDATMPEIILIAQATGVTIGRLTGLSQVEDRAWFAARATDGDSMNGMKAELLSFLELSAYLDDQAI